MDDKTKCPVAGGIRMHANRDWWPTRLNLRSSTILRAVRPDGRGVRLRQGVSEFDLNAVIKDLTDLMTDSQEWWPADFGHDGPLFIRLAWHSAGTYRIADGRGGAGAGQQRFAPLNSWPDNANLTRRAAYCGRSSRNRPQALLGRPDGPDRQRRARVDGFKTSVLRAAAPMSGSPRNCSGVPRGRGSATSATAASASCRTPSPRCKWAIYVNPEGPNGKPDPIASANDIRETFFRMAMNDEETVALIAGGHTFGKTHGAGDPSLIGPEPEGADPEDQGLGWKSKYGKGFGADAITGGPEDTWSQTPTQWSNHFFDNLFNNEWELTKSPAGAKQWRAKGSAATVPDDTRPVEEARSDHADHRSLAASRPGLREDLTALLRASGPVRRRLCSRLVQAHPPRYGPDRALSRPAGAEGGADLAGPDPGREPSADRPAGHRGAEGTDPGLRFVRLPQVAIAWASASTFRGSDKRGGANGARVRLAPQKDGEVNQPAQLASVLQKLDAIQDAFNASAAAARRFRSPTSSCWAVGRRSRRPPRRPDRTSRSPSRPGAWTSCRLRPTRIVCPARADRRRFPQLSARPATDAA